jgi:archaellin
VIAVSPEAGATGVPLDKVIVITFNRAINSETFTYTVTPDPGGWSQEWSGDQMTVTLGHAAFEIWTEYTVRVTGAQDMVGNPMDEPYVWSFESEPIRTFLPVVLKRWAHPSTRR